MKIIDSHVHVLPADLDRYPLAAGFGLRHIRFNATTVEEFSSLMREAGVQKAILIQPDFFGFDNSYIADAITDYPQVFRGVAVVDQDDVRVSDTMQSLTTQGFRGFRIYPKNQPIESWLNSAAMKQMWETATAYDVILCCLLDPDALPALASMSDKFPTTRVVIDHIARIGVSGDITQEPVDLLASIARCPNISIKISAFYALGQKKPPYQDLIPLVKTMYNAFGADRLLWGSDNPFQLQGIHTYQASLIFVQGLTFLSNEEKEKILGGNAEQIFQC